MGRVTHFEIQAENPPRAAKFYQAVFDWSISKWEGPMDYWMVATGSKDEPGIDGTIAHRYGPATDGIAAFVCTIDVRSLDETTAKVLDAGGQLAVPKLPIPGIGFMAYCKDTEGNLFGVREFAFTAR